MATEAPVPIRRVRRDGTVDELGEWRPSTKELVLHRAGFPLTPPGVHHIEGDLPWVFDAIAPEGFLASQFSRAFPELHLPADWRLWSPTDVLQILSRRGEDLGGNLVVGNESFDRLSKRDAPDISN